MTRSLDDPERPEPDARALSPVVGRGPRRFARRRVIFGAIGASVVAVLVASAAAVAQHRDASPDIAVNPPTTIAADASETVREADANGLHFTLTLVTPEVAPLQDVKVTLRVDNGSDALATLVPCDLRGITIDQGPLPAGGLGTICPQPGIGVASGASYTWSASAKAPPAAGVYAVVAHVSDAIPATLSAPLSLRVTAPHSTAVFTGPTTSNTSPDTVADGAAPTSAVSTPTDGPLGPQRGDFSGTLTTSQPTVAVGDGIDINLYIRNDTAHEIEASQITHPTALGIACTSDLTADGFTTQGLELDVNFWFLTGVSFPPGADAGPSSSVAWFRAREADVGTITCGALIVTADHNDWTTGMIQSTGRVTNIPNVSFTVTPAPVETPATTAPSIESATSTTVVGP